MVVATLAEKISDTKGGVIQANRKKGLS